MASGATHASTQSNAARNTAPPTTHLTHAAYRSIVAQRSMDWREAMTEATGPELVK